MGSERGEADERPVHPVFVKPFWMAETPVDWEWLSRGMGYKPPPWGMPEQGGFRAGFVWEIRQQYCEDATERASDWHNHYYEAIGEEAWPYRPQRPAVSHGYGQKPVVAVHLDEALEFCQRTRTRLPSEAEWEKAARGHPGSLRFSSVRGFLAPAQPALPCERVRTLSSVRGRLGVDFDRLRCSGLPGQMVVWIGQAAGGTGRLLG